MEDLRLDGNAAAGLLSEVFTPEATAAVVRCASCGSEHPVATAQVYAQGPGTVLRCPGCEAVIMRFAHIRDRLVADLRGVARMTF
jgi:hypothetical protein